MPGNKNASTYASSPLGQIVTEILQHIAYLKRKYSQAASSSEIISELNSLKSFEWRLKKLDEQILPQFDRYKKPSLVRIVSHISQQDLDFFKLSIHDPSTFELAELLLRLIRNAPKEFASLIPFFNPEALNCDFLSGVNGILLNRLVGYKILLQHKKTHSSSEPSFTYEYVLEQAGINSKKTLCGETLYRNYLADSAKKLLMDAQTYFTKNAEEPFVTSQVICAQSLRLLMQAEGQALIDELTGHTSNYYKTSSDCINAELLSDEITHVQSLLKKNEALQKALKERATSYSTKTFSELVLKHPHLQEYLAADSMKHCFPYSKELLPDYIIEPSHLSAGEANFFSVKEELQQAILSQTLMLQNSYSELSTRINRLIAQRQQLITHWQRETLSLGPTKLDKPIASLSQIEHAKPQQQLKTIANKINEELPTQEQQLKTLNLRLNKQLHLINALNKECRNLIESLLLLADKYKLQISGVDQENLLNNESSYKIFINKFGKAVEKTQKENQKILLVLNEVRQCLQNAERIPFTSIEKLPSLLKLRQGTKKGGFDLLLYIIGLHSEIVSWRKYRFRQDDFFTKGPCQAESKQQRTLLIKSIDQKILLLKSMPYLESMSHLKDSLPNIKKELSDKLSEKNKLVAEAKAIEAEIQQKTQLLGVLEQQHAENIKKQKFLTDASTDELISKLTGLQHAARVFEDNILQEHSEIPRQYSEKLSSVKLELSELLDDEENHEEKLEEMPGVSKKTANIQALQKAINQQLAESTAINNKLLKRIKERAALVKELSAKLDEYSKEIKGCVISSGNQGKCYLFINEIQKQLSAYALSGDSRELLEHIERNLKRYSAVNLKAVLNKITIELKELDEKIPKNYNEITQEPDGSANVHPRAIQLLGQLVAKHEHIDYVLACKQLYEQIGDLKKNSLAVHLANKLRYALDCFILAHPNQLPTDKAYQQFKKDFITRLHSEDDVMNKHRALWKIILGNLIIGLCTLGLALGIKLIYSTFSEEQSTLFFFTKTNRQKQIEAIEKLTEKVMLSPSGYTLK